jgi:hypothetical protein
MGRGSNLQVLGASTNGFVFSHNVNDGNEHAAGFLKRQLKHSDCSWRPVQRD